MEKYRVDIAWSEEDQAFIARVPELDGVVTHGASVKEAAEHAEEAIALHLESLAAHNEPAPEPVALKKLSGQYPLRMGRERHEKLVIESTKQHLSVNEFLVTLIDLVLRSDTVVSTRHLASGTRAKLKSPRSRAKGKAG